MSAHCYDCGNDLSYDLSCGICARVNSLRKRAERAEEALREIVALKVSWKDPRWSVYAREVNRIAREALASTEEKERDR